MRPPAVAGDYHPGLSPSCERLRESNNLDANDINTCFFWLWCTTSIFKLGEWDGPLLLPLLFPLRSRFSEAFSQGDWLPLRAVLHLLSCSNILNPP